MDYHLDYNLRVNNNPEYRNLYTWAINEIDADAHVIGQNQIPWVWTLIFAATSCVLINRFEIEAQFSLNEDRIGPPRIETGQVIRMTLRSGSWRNGELIEDVKYSMFGTKRVIQSFALEVRPLNDPIKSEYCVAWGGVSYTTEVDFRTRTEDDCIVFYLYVKPETFVHYAALVSEGAIDIIHFSVGSVDGFYSEWSPAVSTNRIKVLVSAGEHKVDMPPDWEGEPPRLGHVQDARLLLHRRLMLDKDGAPPPSNSDEGDFTTPANPALQVPAVPDSGLLPVLASLRRAAWLAIAILVVIAAAVIFRL